VFRVYVLEFGVQQNRTGRSSQAQGRRSSNRVVCIWDQVWFASTFHPAAAVLRFFSIATPRMMDSCCGAAPFGLGKRGRHGLAFFYLCPYEPEDREQINTIRQNIYIYMYLYTRKYIGISNVNIKCSSSTDKYWNSGIIVLPQSPLLKDATTRQGFLGKVSCQEPPLVAVNYFNERAAIDCQLHLVVTRHQPPGEFTPDDIEDIQ